MSQAFERIGDRAREAYESECRRSGVKPDEKMFKDLRFHDLRHEATSRLFERGRNPMEVSSITGHKTLQMLKQARCSRSFHSAKRFNGGDNFPDLIHKDRTQMHRQTQLE